MILWGVRVLGDFDREVVEIDVWMVVEVIEIIRFLVIDELG